MNLKNSSPYATVRTAFVAVVALSAAVALSTSGCSKKDTTTSATEVASSSTSATASSPSTASQAPSVTTTTSAAPAAAKVTSGLLLLDSQTNTQKPTYGFLDPTSGQYSQAAQFTIPSESTGGVQFPAIAASPDLTKFAITERIDGQQQAGWIDTEGKFTGVTPVAAASDPFGGSPPLYTAIGFDGNGNFYYQMADGGGHPRMFELPAGQTNNPTEITTRGAQSSELDPSLGYDGSMQFGCNNITSWLGPNAIVFVAGGQRQIDKRPVNGVDDMGCPTYGSPDVDLLPAANTARVMNAVGNKDGTQVAFQFDQRDLPGPASAATGTDLYLVNADGVSQPTKVELKGITAQQLAFSTMLRWQ